jgi:hypothetical protein
MSQQAPFRADLASARSSGASHLTRNRGLDGVTVCHAIRWGIHAAKRERPGVESGRQFRL